MIKRRRGRPRKGNPEIGRFESVEVSGVDGDTTCIICQAEFLDPQDLMLHFEQVHGNVQNLIKCEFCIQKFADSERLALHIRNEHICNLKVCKYCTRCFLKENERAIHEKRHSTSIKNKFSCSNCKKVFDLTKELELHEIEAHPADSGVLLQKHYPLLSSVLNIPVEKFLKSLGSDTAYVCQKCTYTNSEPERYINHLKKSNCISHACDKCSNIFSNISLISKHLGRSKKCLHYAKDADLVKQCPKCRQSIINDIFNEHKRKCEAIACQLCDLVFDTGVSYAEHHTTVHPNTVSIETCKYCFRNYVGETALQKHIERIHQSELHLYKYKCIECDVIYKHPKMLFIHFLKSHPDLLPFTCNICNKSYKLRQKFTAHIRLEHKGIGKVKFVNSSHVVFDEKKADDKSEELAENEPNSTQDKVDDVTKEILSEESEETSKDEENANPEEDSVDKEHDVTAKESNKEEVQEKNKMIEIEINEATITLDDEKRKRRHSQNTQESMQVEFLETESDEEPIATLYKKAKRAKRTKSKRKDLSCSFCNKKCYTVQNYNSHIAMHNKNKSKKCIKCAAVFKTEKELKKHITVKHSKSALTETLKRLLENRRKAEQLKQQTQKTGRDMTEKFRRTIKKVEIPKSDVVAKITEIKTGISDFIENFTPEVSEKKKEIKINTNLTFKKVDGYTARPPAIKIYKFKPPKPLGSVVKLAMPVKCNLPPPSSEHKATIKVVSNIFNYNKPKLNFGSNEEYIIPDQSIYESPDTQDDDTQDTSGIPEVAQEVMLDTTGHVDPPKNKFTHKIIIPNVTDFSGYEQIRIAHLLPEAPYYKIVKVKDIIDTPDKSADLVPEVKIIEEKVQLPSGTKLVNVNPLAHLLKNKTIAVPKTQPKRKRRKTKPKKDPKNYETAVAKALLKLENSVEKVCNERKKAKTETAKKKNYTAEITLTHDVLEPCHLQEIIFRNKQNDMDTSEAHSRITNTTALQKRISIIAASESAAEKKRNAKKGAATEQIVQENENQETEKNNESIEEQQRLVISDPDQNANENEPTEIEYLEDFDDYAGVEQTVSTNTNTGAAGLSLPEL